MQLTVPLTSGPPYQWSPRIIYVVMSHPPGLASYVAISGPPRVTFVVILIGPSQTQMVPPPPVFLAQ